MYAKRMNKTYAVNTPQEKQAYLARGFDIYDEDDDLLESSPQKTVAYAEHQKLRAASEAMRKELSIVRADNAQMKQQLAALQIVAPSDELLKGFATAPIPDEMLEVFDATPAEAAPDPLEDEVKTLRTSEDSAPKMGKKK